MFDTYNNYISYLDGFNKYNDAQKIVKTTYNDIYPDE